MKTSFFIRKNGKFVRINLEDILYIEGCRNYLKIKTGTGTYLVLITFKRMEELLEEKMFIRVHKSYIVALDKVESFCTDSVTVNGKLLPIGDFYRGRLEKMVTILTEEAVHSFGQSITPCASKKLQAV